MVRNECLCFSNVTSSPPSTIFCSCSILFKRKRVCYPHTAANTDEKFITLYWIGAEMPDRLCRCELCKSFGDPSSVWFLFKAGYYTVEITEEPKKITENIQSLQFSLGSI